MWQGACWYKMLWGWDFKEVKQPAVQVGRASIPEETVTKALGRELGIKKGDRKKAGVVCDEIGEAGRAQWCRPWVEFGFDSLLEHHLRAEEGSDSTWFLFLKDHSGCGVCREVDGARIEAGGSGTARVLSDAGDWDPRQQGTLMLSLIAAFTQ